MHGRTIILSTIIHRSDIKKLKKIDEALEIHLLVHIPIP
jgi:hypothetical protein